MCSVRQSEGLGALVRIPLILISHSGRSRSPIPVILITLFTMPEEGHGRQHDVALDSYH
jgi:hypothetical protein